MITFSNGYERLGYNAGRVSEVPTNSFLLSVTLDRGGCVVMDIYGNIGYIRYQDTSFDNNVQLFNYLYAYSSIIARESFAYIAKTANYEVTANDYTIDCTANTFTVTLPTAVGIEGKIYNIKNSGSGVITLATTSSQTIDADVSGGITLNQWDNLQVQSTGANWIIL